MEELQEKVAKALCQTIHAYEKNLSANDYNSLTDIQSDSIKRYQSEPRFHTLIKVLTIAVNSVYSDQISDLTAQLKEARAEVEKLELELGDLCQDEFLEIERLRSALEELYKGLMFLVNQKLITVMPTETLLELAGGVKKALKG